MFPCNWHGALSRCPELDLHAHVVLSCCRAARAIAACMRPPAAIARRARAARTHRRDDEGAAPAL